MKNTKIVHIYYLCDPRDGEPVYVGQTSRSLDRRLSQHIYDGTAFLGAYKDSEKGRWLQNLKLQGVKPEINLLEDVSEEDADRRETYWILRFGGVERLLNLTEGGKSVNFRPSSMLSRIRKRVSGRFKRNLIKGYITLLRGSFNLEWSETDTTVYVCCKEIDALSKGVYVNYEEFIEMLEKSPSVFDRMDYETLEAIESVYIERECGNLCGTLPWEETNNP